LIGIVLGTGPSLTQSAPMVRELGERGALLFGCNNTFEDFELDCWLACDEKWHRHYGKVTGRFDKFHWDKAICAEYGYRYVRGLWIVDGKPYPRDQYITPPGPCGGLWLEDQTSISLNHCSAAQLLNLAVNQYQCETTLLIGHDFHYNGPQRHYFSGLSDKAGEYPSEIRKFSEFQKPDGDDLMAVYKRISEQAGLPRIVNCTPGSALPWFEFGNLEDFLGT
jgi:hypothetical protein